MESKREQARGSVAISVATSTAISVADAGAGTGSGMPRRKRPAIRTDWWSKTLAGAVLGLILALLLSGIIGWATPGGLGVPVKGQFMMWIIAPLWLLVFSAVYALPSGRAACSWLLGANALAATLLVWLKGGPLL